MAYNKINADLPELKRQINEDKLKPVYLFYGTETYLKNKYVERIKSKIPDNGFEEFNYIVLKGKDIPLSEYDDVLESPPMMAERKLVYIRNCGIFKSSTEAQASFWQEKLSHNNDDMVIVFNEDSVDKRSVLYKAAAKFGMAVEFQTPNESDLITFVMGRCLKAKKKIKKEDAYKIIGMCDEGMQNIENELNKLFDYCNDEITAPAIEAVVSKGLSVRIFDLTDAIMKHDSKKAAEIMADLRNGNEEVFPVLYLVYSTLAKILKIKLSGTRDSRAAASLLGMGEFIARKYAAAADGFKTETLEGLIIRIPQIDYEIKSGLIEEWTALEQFVAEAIYFR